jgi:hypothetical protein
MAMIRRFVEKLLYVLTLLVVVTGAWALAAPASAGAQVHIVKTEVPDTFPSMIQGVVYDESGREVTAALVEAFWSGSLEAVRSTQTNDRGFYTLHPLEAGTYVVQVTGDGYQSMTLETTVRPGRFKDLYFEGLQPARPGEQATGADPEAAVGSETLATDFPVLQAFHFLAPDVEDLHRIDFFPVPARLAAPPALEAIDRSTSPFAMMEFGEPVEETRASAEDSLDKLLRLEERLRIAEELRLEEGTMLRPEPPFPDYAAEVATETAPTPNAPPTEAPSLMDVLSGGGAQPAIALPRRVVEPNEPTVTHGEANNDRFWRLIRSSRARTARRNVETAMAIRFPPPPRIVVAQRGSER